MLGPELAHLAVDTERSTDSLLPARTGGLCQAIEGHMTVFGGGLVVIRGGEGQSRVA